MHIFKGLAQGMVRLRPSAIISILAVLALSSLASLEVYGRSDLTLREKDAGRGESIITKLRQLEQSDLAPADSRSYRRLIEKMYPGLFSQVAELRASDLKTELTTAVFLYEEAWRGESESNNGVVDCSGEPRKVYAKLCVANQSGTVSDFLRAKARLHTGWAAAIISEHRGIKDADTAATSEEMRRERQNDLRLAGQAVAALKIVEEKLRGYSSLAEFEEHRALATVPFERLAEDVSEMLESVDRILLSLPRSPLFYSLYHARNSYSNGLFWWQKTYRLRRVAVSVNSFNWPGDIKVSKFDPSVVNYTVAINWRNAIRHTREAIDIIEAS